MKIRKEKSGFQAPESSEPTVAAPGILYVVATPIGNLEDMTFRAVRILREVDLIAAEDTRHSRKLLSHFNIPTPLTSCFEHNEKMKSRFLVGKLLGGASIALITDAGTPCISDPGYHLVAEAVSEGVTVVPVPGACAAMTALSAAGLATDSFLFAGFLPPRQAKRRARLAEFAAQGQILMLYEAPQRLAATLVDIKEILGERRVVVARELTKIHEEFVRGTVSEIIDRVTESTVRGEVVVMVAPSEAASAPHEASIEDLLLREMNANRISLKEAVARVAAESGVPRRQVYATALQISRLRSDGVTKDN